MADTQPNKKKRVVKNPETFRERAIKAAENTGKQSRTSKARQSGKQAVGSVAKPLAKPFSVVAASKPAQPLKRPFRIIGKILLPPYIRQSWRELKLVTWPSFQQSRQLTFAVLIFAFIFGAIIAVVDYGLDKLFKAILLK